MPRPDLSGLGAVTEASSPPNVGRVYILGAAIISDSHGGLASFSVLNPSRLRVFV